MTRDRPDGIERLMMAALDGELEESDRKRFERELDRDPAVRAEWRKFQRVKEVTDTMSFQPPSNVVWEGYWKSIYSRIERGIGWILISIGAIVLISYGAWQAVDGLFASSAPTVVKGAVLAILVGVIILAVSVVREKVFTQRRDKYKEVTQ